MRATADGTFTRTPWHELPPVLGTLLRPRLDDIAAELIQAIRQEVRTYHRPPDSAVGRHLSASVRRALQQFVELTEDPDSPQEHHLLFFQRLGRLEFLNGHSTDGLQAAYRVAARIACRRYLEVAQAASLPAELAMSVSEAVLTHINTLASQSVQGFAAARAMTSGELRRSRKALAERLLEHGSGSAALGEPVAALAQRAQWTLPTHVACVAVRIADGSGPLSTAGFEEDVLVLPRGGELHLVVPEQEGGTGRVDRLAHRLHGRAAALGPTVALDDAWVSLYCARLALSHVRTDAAPGDGAGREAETAEATAAGRGGVLVAAEHLAEVHLLSSVHIGRLMADRTLGALRALPAGKAARLAETLDALLMSWGRTAPEVADALGIHPQTARNRLRQLDELFGERMAEPGFRFEALLALRTRALRSAADR